MLICLIFYLAAVEAEKLLKILRSSKAPMARKRQIMRASFGNYRARMQQEEKKHAEGIILVKRKLVYHHGLTVHTRETHRGMSRARWLGADGDGERQQREKL